MEKKEILYTFDNHEGGKTVQRIFKNKEHNICATFEYSNEPEEETAEQVVEDMVTAYNAIFYNGFTKEQFFASLWYNDDIEIPSADEVLKKSEVYLRKDGELDKNSLHWQQFGVLKSSYDMLVQKIKKKALVKRTDEK